MQSGNTRQAVLVAAALAASAVLAAWWWSSSAHWPDASSALPKTARAEGANSGFAKSARESVVRPLVQSVPAASTAVAPAPVEIESVRSHVGENTSETTPPASKAGEETSPAEAKPSSTASDVAGDESSTSDAEHPAQEPTVDVANSDAGSSDAGAAPPNGTPGVEVGNATPGSAVDADHVTDLFARLFDKIETGDEPSDASRSRDLHDFDARETGGDSERALEQALRERFAEWIATLPPELAQHVLLVSVDCHVEECRVLLGQNGIDFAGRSPQDPSDPLVVMEAAIWSFLGEGLPQQSRWRVISNGWSAAGDSKLDTALWIISLGDKAP